MEINSLSDIHLIAQQRPDKVTFKIPELDASKNEALEQKFNDLLNECGCSSGRQFIMYAAPAYIVAFVLLIVFSPLSKQVVFVLLVGAVIITGIVGKIAGLVQSRKKMARLINEVSGELQADLN
jgi:hypothetical protein